MDYVDTLIKKTKTRQTLKEYYLLDNEINKFLSNPNIDEKEKIKLKDQGLLEAVAIAADGYKFRNKLEHYK